MRYKNVYESDHQKSSFRGVLVFEMSGPKKRNNLAKLKKTFFLTFFAKKVKKSQKITKIRKSRKPSKMPKITKNHKKQGFPGGSKNDVFLTFF